ncbi:MAG: mycothiol-dependent maleylpyruvate isomerase [Acidimicrobiales bacterium]|nr:mycothiol-dependent maleylpyruvate isomerase [Acidimicrobiales bacterium]
MYPSFEARNADIEAGAGRPATDLLADVRDAGARLDSAFAQAPASAWDGSGLTFFGEILIRDVPARRVHEVEVHRVDLGLGYAFSDWPAALLRTELAAKTAQWASRKPMGFDDLPPAALALAPADRFAWLIGRLEVEGLPHSDLNG